MNEVKCPECGMRSIPGKTVSCYCSALGRLTPQEKLKEIKEKVKRDKVLADMFECDWVIARVEQLEGALNIVNVEADITIHKSLHSDRLNQLGYVAKQALTTGPKPE